MPVGTTGVCTVRQRRSHKGERRETDLTRRGSIDVGVRKWRKFQVEEYVKYDIGEKIEKFRRNKTKYKG